MTTLIIARHGNTFGPEDTPTRVGKHTDIPLVDKGRAQAAALGRYLRKNDLLPDVAYSSTLQRTKETAQIALENAACKLPVYALDIFDEIDYGPDENLSEDKVIARIGKEAIIQWDENAIVPQGWNFDPQQAKEDWARFANQITKTHDTMTNNVMNIEETVLVVTSNGIARFAPYITENFDEFKKNYNIKLKTGSLGILRHTDGKWNILEWGVVPLLD